MKKITLAVAFIFVLGTAPLIYASTFDCKGSGGERAVSVTVSPQKSISNVVVYKSAWVSMLNSYSGTAAQTPAYKFKTNFSFLFMRDKGYDSYFGGQSFYEYDNSSEHHAFNFSIYIPTDSAVQKLFFEARWGKEFGDGDPTGINTLLTCSVSN